MYRRATLAVLVVASLAFAAVGGTAQASGAQVTQDRFHGPFAEAAWETTTPTSATEADTFISRDQNGTTHLNIHEYTTNLDSSGNIIGSVDVTGALSGAAMAFDTVGLTSASASGTVPVTRCFFDPAGNPTGCTASTLDVSAAWTGQGDIFHGSFYEKHVLDPANLVVIDRLNGTFRRATATASIGNQTFDVADLVFADLGVSNQLTVTVRPHGC